VVRLGGRTAITNASIRTQPIFNKFEILRLNTSMRQASDPDFSSFLDSIGDNHLHQSVDLGRLSHTQSMQECFDFVFPADITCQSEKCIERAILSPFNQYVDQFNNTILDHLPGDTVTYFSSDHIEEDGEEVVEHPTATPEFLNSLDEPGIPPHELKLKIGAICRLTRNFDASRGLTKNTRVIVRQLHRYSVEIETIACTVAGRPIESVIIHALTMVSVPN
jgi:PIF1-like helicase